MNTKKKAKSPNDKQGCHVSPLSTTGDATSRVGLVFCFIVTCLCSLFPLSFRCACRLLSFQVLAAATTKPHGGWRLDLQPTTARAHPGAAVDTDKAGKGGGGEASHRYRLLEKLLKIFIFCT